MKFKKKSLIYSVIAVSLLILLSSFTPFLRSPVSVFFKLPLGLLTLAKREIGGIIFYHRNFIQNERLKKETGFLRQKLNTLNEIYLENKRLKDLLYFKQKSAYKVTAARVIGRAADNWSSVVLVDKGSFNGIRRGLAAITPLGLAGRVVEVADYTSRVRLINDPNFGVSAIVQRSRQEGMVCGTLGRFLIMKYLPKDCDIKIGDVVITSGLTGVYPKGLLIGNVINIGEDFSGLSRYAVIRPAIDLLSIEELLIIMQ